MSRQQRKRPSSRRAALLSVLVALPFTLGDSAGASAQATTGSVMAHVPSKVDARARYLFYLHGRIVEDQGATAVSPDFGPYDYDGITRALASRGVVVISEVRAKNTDVGVYADSVVRSIGRLREAGVPEDHIAVLGASKGAAIAMFVSDRLPAAGVRYVLLADCNSDVEARIRPRLHGRVLSIYEESDSIGRSCAQIFAKSPDLAAHDEVRLTTGKRHGFLYQPMREWVEPAAAWIVRDAR